MSWLPERILGFSLRKLAAFAGAFAVFAILAHMAISTEPWQAGARGAGVIGNDTMAENGTMLAEGGDANDMDALVTALFDEHVIALEVLGILLTAAMIGALVIARPLGVPEDSSNYGGDEPAPADEIIPATGAAVLAVPAGATAATGATGTTAAPASAAAHPSKKHDTEEE